jgi:sugar phosphate isomerase/epimerase
MSTPNRRHFLGAALAASTGALVAAAPVAAIDPIQRNNRPHFRLSLAAYSFRRYLTLNNNPTMTLNDFIDTAATMPLDAVELTSYYFPETSARYLAALKGRCTRLGLDISGSAVGNNFCVADPQRLRTEITNTKNWIERTSLLGGKTLRIFAGTVPQGEAEERARARCVEAIQEVCEHAANFGVFCALENHGGITGTAEQTLAIVRAVRSEWFGVNLDTGNFHTADPYADLAQLAPYAVVVQLKTEIRRAGQQTEAADLQRLIRILRDVNYRGYIALEHEANEDPRMAVPGHLATLQRLIRV